MKYRRSDEVELQMTLQIFHFISFYLFTAYEEVMQLVKDNTTWAIKLDAKGHLIGDKTDVAPKKFKKDIVIQGQEIGYYCHFRSQKRGLKTNVS